MENFSPEGLSERDKNLLYTVDQLKKLAPEVGILPSAVEQIKQEILYIMGERDGLKGAILKNGDKDWT